VPAHNEADVIERTVAEIREGAPDFEVLVVDDGSTDATADRAARLARVLRLPFNLGVGGAVQAGYMYALEHDYDVAVQVDADGQHDPREIGRLLERLTAAEGVNMVVGSRFLERPDGAFRSSASRRVGIRIFADLRLSHGRPKGHRAVRARLRSGLPGGRGDPADAPTPPAQLRDSRAHAAAHDGPLDDLVGALGLLHGQGAARRADRHLPHAARDRGAPGGRGTGAMTGQHYRPTFANQRIEVILLAVFICALIFELVRRRRLTEGYALLWIVAGATVALLAFWKGLLTQLSHAVGIYYPPSGLFAVAFVFVLALLVHFSLALSRLSDENTRLAQHVALLHEELDTLRQERAPEHEPVDV